MVDSEVDETTGAGYHGVNLWQTTRGGGVTGTGTTVAYSKEPTGLGYDPGTNTLFISDDGKKRIWVVKPGSDGRFGTSDDVVTFVDAGAYGSTDTEDPEFDPATGHLFFLDGVASEVYEINPVNGVFGDGNDLMTHFDVGKFGPTDWEGLGSDPASGTLLVGARTTKQIFEVTKTGSLVRIIDASGISGMRYLSGLAMAPASNGTGQRDYWIVDRAIDNGPNPNENDGRLFEISVLDRLPHPTSGPIGTSVTIGGSGFTGATDVKFNGTSVGSGNFAVVSGAQITATVPSGATTGPISVTTPGVHRNELDGLHGHRVKRLGLRSGRRHVRPIRQSDRSTRGTARVFPQRLDNEPDASTGSVKFTVGPGRRLACSTFQGREAPNTWYVVDLSSLVTGDGTYSIRIASTSGNGVDYSTKEGAAAICGPARRDARFLGAATTRRLNRGLDRLGSGCDGGPRQRLEFFGGGRPEADPAPLLRPRLTLGSYADILLALKAGEC